MRHSFRDVNLIAHETAPGRRRGALSELPFGMVGTLFIAVVSVIAFALGQFSVFGFEFLPHWSLLIGGWLSTFIVLSGVWGTGIEYYVWSGRMLRGGGPSHWLVLAAALVMMPFWSSPCSHSSAIAAFSSPLPFCRCWPSPSWPMAKWCLSVICGK